MLTQGTMLWLFLHDCLTGKYRPFLRSVQGQSRLQSKNHFPLKNESVCRKPIIAQQKVQIITQIYCYYTVLLEKTAV